jgi:hypothetical protein
MRVSYSTRLSSVLSYLRSEGSRTIIGLSTYRIDVTRDVEPSGQRVDKTIVDQWQRGMVTRRLHLFIRQAHTQAAGTHHQQKYL